MGTLEERVKSFNNDLAPLLKKYNLKMGATINFPLYRKLPIEVQLALEILKKHEVEYRIGFQEVNNADKS